MLEPGGARQRRRRDALREALRHEPLLTDAALAERFAVSVQTVRLDRLALGIPEVRGRARAVAERSLRVGAPLGGEVLDLEPGVSAVALLGGGMLAGGAGPASDPALFADAEALALAASGIAPAEVRLVNVKFPRAAPAEGRLVAKAEVLRRRGGAGADRRVVLVQIRAGDRPVLRAKFVVGRAAQSPENAAAEPREGL